jgi:hypothetical protein
LAAAGLQLKQWVGKRRAKLNEKKCSVKKEPTAALFRKNEFLKQRKKTLF